MHLLDEIHQQADVLQRLAATHRETVERLRTEVPAPAAVQVVARGTSENAGRYGAYVWGARNRIPVGFAVPSLTTAYGATPRLDGTLVVGISQSGASPDLVAVMEAAKSQHAPTLTITNTADSPLARLADLTIDIGAGPELAVAATKTYTTTLLAIAQLSEAWGGGSGLDPAALADATEAVLAESDTIATIAARFVDAPASVVLGRGFHYATAHEWALKVTEVTYMSTQGFSTAAFEHGPKAMIEDGFPVLAVVTDGPFVAEISEQLDRLRAQGAVTVVATDVDGLAGDHTIRLPRVAEWLAPIPAIVAGQLFACHLAVAKGLDPDTPRSLSKVTRTH